MDWRIPRLFVPDIRIETVEQLTGERLEELAVDALLLDVDCTLCRYQQEEIPGPAAGWIHDVQQGGWRVCLVSNGRSNRIARLAEQLGVPFVAGALKPFPFGCRRAVQKLAVAPEKTAMVGDQLFADVVAARWIGMKTVLVRPIQPEDEPWFTRLKRPLERWVLRQLAKGDQKSTSTET